jgi:hypothetical protein
MKMAENDQPQTREAAVAKENSVAAEHAEENKTDEQREEDEENNPVHTSLDNMPEGTAYVGLLEYEVNPDHVDESAKQQAENYPRVQAQTFRPEELEPEEPRMGRSATARAMVGRVVVIENDVIHDGEVYKAGVQDIPLDVADELIADGMAWEPAGKKRGR